jgi:peptide/nickel transport system substrate-binding protein
MRFRLFRLRFRRRIRKGQQQVEDIGAQAEEHIERHLFGRFGRLAPVRRFVFGWLLLIGILIAGLIGQNIFLSGYYQTLAAVPGGIYNEGILGTFTTANPLYATSDVDSSVSHLIFAGLFKYNEQNLLVGDLATDYTVDAKGIVYTVHLKPNLTWQDGKPLTSKDVVYTYRTIQNPDAQSPLQSAWQGINITALDSRTITFTLPGPLASFPYNMTNGIIPEHLLASTGVSDLRSVEFNTSKPVGAGPFKWKSIQVNGSNPATAQEQIELLPFDNYQGGKPKLQEFNILATASEKYLVNALNSKQITGLEGLNEVSKDLKNNSSIQDHNMILTAATMVFFKTSSGILADAKVRQALVQSANAPNIVDHLGYATHAVREPLLMGQLAYQPSLQQPGYDLNAAKTLLSADGWNVGAKGIRFKDGKPLHFNLTVADTPEYRMVVKQLQNSWSKAGVSITPIYLGPADLKSAVSQHDYESVLYGISIGVDPDVYVYWDSSQADIRSANRLNLSEYKNATADASLEAGRTRLIQAIRVIKYKPFLQVWQQDNPALGLYQPRFLYLTNGTVSGLSDHTLNTPTDRYSNVQNWEVRQAKVTD